jgi:hypothetical protein
VPERTDITRANVENRLKVRRYTGRERYLPQVSAPLPLYSETYIDWLSRGLDVARSTRMVEGLRGQGRLDARFLHALCNFRRQVQHQSFLIISDLPV